MNLLFGLMVMVGSWVLCWGLSTLIGLNLYWPMALGWAIWAAIASQRDGLGRYERVFPLKPGAVFFTVLLMWPIALPWFVRLKTKAGRGDLAVQTRPSRAKYVVVGLAVAVPVLAFGVSKLISTSELFQPLLRIQAAMAGESRMSINISGPTVTLSIPNSEIPIADTSARRREAYRLARKAATALDSFPAVTDISVSYIHVGGTAGISVTRSEGSYHWLTAELRDRSGGNGPVVSVPHADGRRLELGTDSLFVYWVTKGDTAQTGQIFETLTTRHIGEEEQLVRSYETHDAGLGTNLDTIIDERTRLAPRYYHRSGNSYDLQMAFGGDSATGVMQPLFGKRVAVRHLLPRDAIDAASFDLYLRSVDLGVGQQIDLEGFVVRDGTVIPLDGKVIAEERIDSTDCWRVQAEFGRLPVEFWIAKRGRRLRQQKMYLKGNVQVLFLSSPLRAHQAREAET